MKFRSVTFVKSIEKYHLQVEFDDGVNGVYDVSHLAGKGVFKDWENGDSFNKVFVDKESGL